MFTPSEKLPADNRYVLIYVPNRPWADENDPEGNRFWKVAKLVRGISVIEREQLPDYDVRKCTYRRGDEWGNNLQPYCWQEFGPGVFFGQEVTLWTELPRVQE